MEQKNRDKTLANFLNCSETDIELLAQNAYSLAEQRSLSEKALERNLRDSLYESANRGKYSLIFDFETGCTEKFIETELAWIKSKNLKADWSHRNCRDNRLRISWGQDQDDLLDLLSEIQDIQRSCTTKIAAYYHILEAGGSPEDLSNLANTIVSLSWDVRYDLLRLKISKKFSGEIREACADGIEAFADASVFRVVEFEYRVKELDLARVSNRTKIASNRHQAELLEAKANNCIASIVVAEGDIE